LSGIVLGRGLFIVRRRRPPVRDNCSSTLSLGSDGAVLIQDQAEDTQRSRVAGGYGSGFEIASNEGVKYLEGIDDPESLESQTHRDLGDRSADSPVINGQMDLTSASRRKKNPGFSGSISPAIDKARNSSGKQIFQGVSTIFAPAFGRTRGRELATRRRS